MDEFANGWSTSDQFEWMYACCHSVLCLKPFSLYCLDCEMIDFSINNLLECFINISCTWISGHVKHVGYP